MREIVNWCCTAVRRRKEKREKAKRRGERNRGTKEEIREERKEEKLDPRENWERD